MGNKNNYNNMKYLKIDIPSYIIPEKGYILDKGIYIFPSKLNVPSKVVDKVHLTFLITEESNCLDNVEDIKKCVKSFVVFLNFISYSIQSATWLQSANFKELFEDLNEADNIQEILEVCMEKGKSQPLEFYQDYNNLVLRIGSPKEELRTRVDFISLFSKYNKLSHDNLLKQRIDLLSFTTIQFILIGNYYDNQNIEISLVYNILDSIIKESLDNKPIIKKCENCGFEKTVSMNDKARIKEFVKLLAPKNPTLWRDIIMNLYLIRNDFFYLGQMSNDHETLKDAFEKDVQDTGERNITVEEEVHYNKSRMLGLTSVKVLIRKILIGFLETSAS